MCSYVAYGTYWKMELNKSFITYKEYKISPEYKKYNCTVQQYVNNKIIMRLKSKSCDNFFNWVAICKQACVSMMVWATVTSNGRSPLVALTRRTNKCTKIRHTANFVPTGGNSNRIRHLKASCTEQFIHIHIPLFFVTVDFILARRESDGLLNMVHFDGSDKNQQCESIKVSTSLGMAANFTSSHSCSMHSLEDLVPSSTPEVTVSNRDMLFRIYNVFSTLSSNIILKNSQLIKLHQF